MEFPRLKRTRNQLSALPILTGTTEREGFNINFKDNIHLPLFFISIEFPLSSMSDDQFKKKNDEKEYLCLYTCFTGILKSIKHLKHSDRV